MRKIAHITYLLVILAVVVGILIGVGIMLANEVNPLFLFAWVSCGLGVLGFIASLYK